MTHECITHHNACDCREAEHLYQIETRDREIKQLRKLAKDYLDAIICDSDSMENYVIAKKALQEALK